MRFLATLRFARNDSRLKVFWGISGGKAAAYSYTPFGCAVIPTAGRNLLFPTVNAVVVPSKGRNLLISTTIAVVIPSKRNLLFITANAIVKEQSEESPHPHIFILF
jgi:hypothetical protein